MAGPLVAGLFPRAGQSFASVGTAAITLVLVAGLRWINCRVMPVIDRWFFRDAYGARQILTELSHSIRRSPCRPDLLLNTVSDRIQRTLHPRCLTIFLRDDDWFDLEPEDGLAGVKLPVGRRDGEELLRPFFHRREGGHGPAGIDATPFRLDAAIPETSGLGLLLDRADGPTERLPATGTVLGAFEEWEGSVAGVKLKPKDLFLLFSDGITEAVTARVRNSVNRDSSTSPGNTAIFPPPRSWIRSSTGSASSAAGNSGTTLP